MKKAHGLVIGIHASLLDGAADSFVFQDDWRRPCYFDGVAERLVVAVISRGCTIGRSEAAVKCRELLLYSAIGAAGLIVFSSIHPAVWLPLAALLYYAFYRRREDSYLGGSILGDDCFGAAVLTLATRAAKRQFRHHCLGGACWLRGSVLVVGDE